MSAQPQAGGSYRTDPKTGELVLVERTKEARHIDARKPGITPAVQVPPSAPVADKKRAADKE